MTNAYQVLEIRNFATRKEVRHAYRSLSKQYHPDMHRGDKYYEEKFKEIQAAYTVLSDFGQRMELDTYLRRQDAAEMDMVVDQEPAETMPEPDQAGPQFQQSTTARPSTECTAKEEDEDVNVRQPVSKKRRVKIVLNILAVFVLMVTAIYFFDNKKGASDTFVAGDIEFAAVSDKPVADDPAKSLLPESTETTADREASAKRKGRFFSINSTKEEVREIQGEPTDILKVNALKQEIWYYEMSSITFDNNRVSEYANVAKNLQVSYFQTIPKASPKSVFSIGSTKSEVLMAQGDPSGTMRIKPLNQEIWYYGESSVTFEKGRVNEYANDGKNLKISYFEGDQANNLAQAGGGSYSIGATKDDVLRIQGNPTSTTKMNALNKEIWRYGVSQITFEYEQVSDYSNIGKNLKIR